MLALRNIFSVFKREMKAFFLTPIAYVIIIVFVFFSMLLAFSVGGLLESADASLRYPFLLWTLPLISFFAPAVAMRLWADEQRDGTIELLLTMPTHPWQAILGKFLAAACVWLLALVLTLSIVFTISFLGDPDPGPIWGAYLGAFLHACVCLSITMAVSAFSRSQVVCFIISVTICLLLSMLGALPFIQPVKDVFGERITDAISASSPVRHAWEMGKGVIRFSDLFYFVSVTVVGLAITSIAIRAQRA